MPLTFSPEAKSSITSAKNAIQAGFDTLALLGNINQRPIPHLDMARVIAVRDALALVDARMRFCVEPPEAQTGLTDAAGPVAIQALASALVSDASSAAMAVVAVMDQAIADLCCEDDPDGDGDRWAPLCDPCDRAERLASEARAAAEALAASVVRMICATAFCGLGDLVNVLPLAPACADVLAFPKASRMRLVGASVERVP